MILTMKPGENSGLSYIGQPRGKLDTVWPLRVLTIRVHPTYQMVGLVKEDSLEEIVAFSKETGKSPSGQTVLMDLDSLRDPVLRANTAWEILRSILGFYWNIARMFKMIMVRPLKEKYNEYRRKEIYYLERSLSESHIRQPLSHSMAHPAVS